MNAIGMLELKSIAKGIECCDHMLKASDIELISSKTICPGKYIVFIKGDVAAVEAAMDSGENIGKENVIDSLIIPNIHEQVFPALIQTTDFDHVEAVGIIETMTVTSAIIAADSAVKSADIVLVSVMLATGLGGKAYIICTGEVGSVEAAISSGLNSVKEKGTVIESVIIPNPHERLKDALV